MENPTAYDYRMYDRIWKRVSPELDPYGDVPAAQADETHGSNGVSSSPQTTGLSVQSGSVAATAETEAPLPGEQLNPCCMGSEAMESIEVLGGFIEEELAQRRCYLGLASRVCHGGAARLLRGMAAEKLAAAQALKTTYFLITGSCYENIISIDHMRWNSLADALRSCYHQEACNGFNYQRSAEETIDTCLQKVLFRLSRESFARAEAVMELLGRILC